MFNLGFGGSPFQGPQMGLQQSMGFGGQFGGGFIQGPPSGVGEGGGQVVYAMDAYRTRPRDRSGRKGAYEGFTFPVGPEGFQPTTMTRARRSK
jgi:hypothetical protein